MSFDPASSTMVIAASQRSLRPAGGEGAGARGIWGYAQWHGDLALGGSREKGEGWRGQQQWRVCKGLGLPHGSNESRATAALKPISFSLSMWRLAVKTDKRCTPAYSRPCHCAWPLPESGPSHQHAQPGAVQTATDPGAGRSSGAIAGTTGSAWTTGERESMGHLCGAVMGEATLQHRALLTHGAGRLDCPTANAKKLWRKQRSYGSEEAWRKRRSYRSEEAVEEAKKLGGSEETTEARKLWRKRVPW
jgi:hypothetical protein